VLLVLVTGVAGVHRILERLGVLVEVRRIGPAGRVVLTRGRPLLAVAARHG